MQLLLWQYCHFPGAQIDSSGRADFATPLQTINPTHVLFTLRRDTADMSVRIALVGCSRVFRGWPVSTGIEFGRGNVSVYSVPGISVVGVHCLLTSLVEVQRLGCMHT